MVTIRLSDLEKTCESCPSQWQGHAVDGRPVYIRFRWGWLTISIADVGGDPVGGREIFSHQLSDGLDGTLSDDGLVAAVSGKVRVVRGGNHG